MRSAVSIVNQNQSRIEGTLRASGSADGYFTTPQGRRRSFHLDATLFFLGPKCFRADLKKFGSRQVLFGSNDERYWFYSKKDARYFCGRHGVADDLPEDIPMRPDQIIDALGLSKISQDAEAVILMQRVEEDYQQLLFVTHDEQGKRRLSKEYWLDRRIPQLIRHVVFRDCDGVVEMHSELGEYERLGTNGPMLPRLILVDWPKTEARIHFHVSRWTLVEQVNPDSIQFATPRECDVQ